MNIAEQINASTQELIDSGKLKQMIDKHLEDALQRTVKDTIDSFFRWGDGNKAVSSIVQSSLKFDTKTLTLPDYRELVLARLRDLVDQEMSGVGAEMIKKCVDKVKGDYPTEITFEGLMQRFFEEEFDDEDRQCQLDISLHIDVRSTLVFVHMDKDQAKRYYECEHRLVINKEGAITSYENSGAKRDTALRFGRRYGFSHYLFGLYSAGTKITGADKADSEELSHHYPVS